MRSSGKYPPSSCFGIGLLRIDLERGTVSGQDGTAGLTSRAEHLLLLLARYPNLLVTREQILETVWAGRVVEDAAITNCIWQIRKALGERGKEILLTRAKRGYLLVVEDSEWIVDDPLPSADGTSGAQAGSVSADLPTPEIPDAPAAEASDSPPVRMPRRVRWALGLAAVVAAVALTYAVIAWRATRETPDLIQLQPDVDLTVSIEVPDKLGWLRGSILRSVVDQAYLRGTPVVLLQQPQRRNPFAGAHLQVVVASGNSDLIKAEMSLRRGDLRFGKAFAGPATELHRAIEALLNAALAPAKAASTPAADAFVSARVADLQFDHLAALAEYRHALALEPDFVDAKIALASTLAELGNSMEAQAILKNARPGGNWTAQQRCAHALLAVTLLPESPPRPGCDLADIRSNLNPKGARLAQRRLDAISARPMGASQWFLVQAMSVEARQYLGAHPEAESRSTHAERVAAEAGWEQARWRFAAERCKSVLYTGRNEEGIGLCTASADALAAMGDTLSSLRPRTLALRTQRGQPGEATAAQRKDYRAIVDRARSIGSPQGEVDALLALIALDRDDPLAWRNDVARVQELIDKYYASALRIDVANDLTTEHIAMRRYRTVLKRVADLEGSAGAVRPGDELTMLYLKAQSYFALDELVASLAQIDEMGKKGFDVADTNPCLFAWLYVEVEKPDRARVMLKACPYDTWDSKSKAGLRGDWGLLANALLHRLDGEPERAWPAVRPRIDELLEAKDLSRLEAEGLVFLARHATAMPGADPDRLTRALTVSAAMAEKDGAGPNLRFGVHVLRWRLCMLQSRTDCGPTLPAWAQDDRLEQRLALQAAGH